MKKSELSKIIREIISEMDINEKEVDRIPTDTVFNPPIPSDRAAGGKSKVKNMSRELARSMEDFRDYISTLPADDPQIQPLLGFPWGAFIRTLGRFDIGAGTGDLSYLGPSEIKK